MICCHFAIDVPFLYLSFQSEFIGSGMTEWIIYMPILMWTEWWLRFIRLENTDERREKETSCSLNNNLISDLYAKSKLSTMHKNRHINSRSHAQGRFFFKIHRHLLIHTKHVRASPYIFFIYILRCHCLRIMDVTSLLLFWNPLCGQYDWHY